MCIPKKQYFLLFLAAALAGFGLHSLYDRFPILPIALLAPVQESLWEHLKLLFWPCLAAALFLYRRGCPLRPRLFTLLLLCAIQLGVSPWDHILLGGESVAVDIALYLLLVTAAFVIPCLLRGPYTGGGWPLVLPLTLVLACLILLFSLFPP